MHVGIFKNVSETLSANQRPLYAYANHVLTEYINYTDKHAKISIWSRTKLMLMLQLSA